MAKNGREAAARWAAALVFMMVQGAFLTASGG